jgi:hypothetical protein
VKLFATVAWRLPWTFDSSATPEIGKRAIVPKRLATPDLVKLRERMVVTIEKAKADDPKELRKVIASLRAEIAQRHVGNIQQPVRNTPQKVREVPAITRKLAKRIEVLGSRMIAEANKHGKAMAMFWEEQETCWKAVLDALRAVSAGHPRLHEGGVIPRVTMRDLDRVRALDLHPTVPSTSSITSRRRGSALGQRILDAIAWWKAAGIDQPTRQQVGFVTDTKIAGGHFANTASRLHTQGLLAYPISGRLDLTPKGMAEAKAVAAPATRDGLLAMIRQMLGTDLKGRMFNALVEADKALSREDLAAVVGADAEGGHFSNSVSRLSSLGIVSYPSPGMVGLSDLVNFA